MKTVIIDGVTLPIRPTPAAKIWPALPVLQKDPTTWGADDWAIVQEAVFWGIRRAGGEITMEWLAMNLDLGSFGPVLKVFGEINALVANEGAPAGEGPGAPTP